MMSVHIKPGEGQMDKFQNSFPAAIMKVCQFSVSCWLFLLRAEVLLSSVSPCVTVMLPVSAGLCLQVKLQRCLPFKHKVSTRGENTRSV